MSDKGIIITHIVIIAQNRDNHVRDTMPRNFNWIIKNFAPAEIPGHNLIPMVEMGLLDSSYKILCRYLNALFP